MEMKEFYYKDGVRLSIFNVDHKSVPFHYHDNVSDILYCSKGTIGIELPTYSIRIRVECGQSFQIPIGIKHRFMNLEEGGDSQYVLIQFGDFNINFLKKDETSIEFDDCNPHSVNTVFYNRKKDDLIMLAYDIAVNKPSDLTDEEAKNVIIALLHFILHGGAGMVPTEKEFVDRLKHAS